MTVTQMAKMAKSQGGLGSWYIRHPEEIGMKTGDVPPGYVNPWAEPGSDITGRDPNSWQVIEVSESVTKELKELAFQHMKENYGMSGDSGWGANDIIKAYKSQIPAEDCYNATRTLTQIFRNEALRLQDFVRSRIPGWQTGQPFDTSILDDYTSGIDVKV